MTKKMIAAHQKHANQTLTAIKDYFWEQHAFLQNYEHKILENFKGSYVKLESETKQKYNMLDIVSLKLMVSRETPLIYFTS
jgi:hypothetical protein